MNCKTCNKHNPRKVDICMINISSTLELCGYKVVASCCGHNKYPISIIIHNRIGKYNIELVSGIMIKREKRFYVKDEEGYYYIPEIVSQNNTFPK